MRRHHAWLALLALVATAPAADGNIIARTRIEQSLSGFDYLPTAAAILESSSGDLSQLLTLAASSDPTISPGMRARALRALGQFPDDIARSTLTNAVMTYRDSGDRLQVIFLLAAVEGLGQNGGDAAVPVLASVLTSDQRDARVAAALALAATDSPDACAPLRVQNTHETNPQVRAALQTALAQIDDLCITGVH